MILILTHYTKVPGTSDHFLKYLESSGKDFDFYFLPLEARTDLQRRRVKRAGGKSEEQKWTRVGGLIGDILFSASTMLQERSEVFVGFDPLSFFQGFFTSKIRNPDTKTVFYSVDYTPSRFSNPVLNFLYQTMDKFSLTFSDQVWTVSHNMQRARMSMMSDPNKVAFVPNGSWNDSSSVDISRKEGAIELVYVGTVNEISGVPKLARMIRDMDITFNIIGTGKGIKEVEVLNHPRIVFHGLMANEDLLKLLSRKRWVGVAPFNPVKESHINYGFAIKVAEYLSCGLPSVCPTWVEPSGDIAATGSGFVYSDESNLIDIVRKVRDLTDSQYDEMAREALLVGQKFHWANIYGKAFAGLQGSGSRGLPTGPD